MGTLVDLARAAYIREDSAQPKKLLLLLAHGMSLLLCIVLCSGFAQLSVVGNTSGD